MVAAMGTAMVAATLAVRWGVVAAGAREALVISLWVEIPMRVLLRLPVMPLAAMRGGAGAARVGMRGMRGVERRLRLQGRGRGWGRCGMHEAVLLMEDTSGLRFPCARALVLCSSGYA